MSTGTYAIGNVEFALLPSAGKWISRSPIGITGDGHEVYGRTHDFECRWQLSTQASIFQLNNYFLAVGVTGTVVVSLPEYGAAVYEFKNYTGCVLSELQMNDYFSEHTTDVRLLIRGIVV